MRLIISSLLAGAICAVGCLLAFAAAKKTSFVEEWLTRKMIAMSVVSGILCGIAAFLHEKSAAAQVLDILLVVFMTLLAFIDIEKHIVPNRILFVALICFFAVAGAAVIADIEAGLRIIFTSLAGALFCGIVFLLCYIISRHQLGGGDVKLSFVMGLYLGGARVVFALVVGMLLCLAYSLIKLARKKITVKDGVPLVPFLFIGTLATLVFTA